MRKLRIGLIICAVIVIIAQLILIDFNDLSWSKNAGSYLGILSMTCIIIAMIWSNRYEKKQSK